MAKHDHITPKLQAFIGEQPLFFVATAAPQGRVNVSPKGMDSLRVLDPHRVVWLNVTGSGNETAAHLLQTPRMTLMWCAFTGAPNILRVYGTARMIQPPDAEWEELSRLFPPLPKARQVFDLQVELVQTSCGMSVPLLDYRGERDDLNRWATKMPGPALRLFRKKFNTRSIDDFPTGLRQAGEAPLSPENTETMPRPSTPSRPRFAFWRKKEKS